MSNTNHFFYRTHRNHQKGRLTRTFDSMDSTSLSLQALLFIGVVAYLVYSIFKRAETEGEKETEIPIYSLIANKRELPGRINSIFCVFVVFFMLIVSADLHWAWKDAQFDFAEEEREQCRSVSSHQASDCEYNLNGMYFDTDGPQCSMDIHLTIHSWPMDLGFG